MLSYIGSMYFYHRSKLSSFRNGKEENKQTMIIKNLDSEMGKDLCGDTAIFLNPPVFHQKSIKLPKLQLEYGIQFVFPTTSSGPLMRS